VAGMAPTRTKDERRRLAQLQHKGVGVWIAPTAVREEKNPRTAKQTRGRVARTNGLYEGRSRPQKQDRRVEKARAAEVRPLDETRPTTAEQCGRGVRTNIIDGERSE